MSSMAKFVGDDSYLMLMRAIAAQAVYDYQSAIAAGAMDARGRITKPRQRTNARGRKRGFIMGAGNSELVNTSMGDLQSLSRCVQSDSWVDSMRTVSGVPVSDAKEFRSLAISRGRERMNARFDMRQLQAPGLWRR